jgi:hypothetical protein
VARLDAVAGRIPLSRRPAGRRDRMPRHAVGARPPGIRTPRQRTPRIRVEALPGAGGERGFLGGDGSPASEPSWLRTASTPAGPAWNPLAVLSLLAAATLTPVGLVLGVLALVQLRDTRQRGRTVAVAGVALGVALLVAYVVLLAPVIDAAAGPRP